MFCYTCKTAYRLRVSVFPGGDKNQVSKTPSLLGQLLALRNVQLTKVSSYNNKCHTKLLNCKNTYLQLFPSFFLSSSSLPWLQRTPQTTPIILFT